MRRLDIALIVGWLLSVSLCLVAVRRRMWPAALAIAVLLAAGVTALTIRESRLKTVVTAPVPDRPVEEESFNGGEAFRYAASVLAEQFRRRAQPLPRSVRVEVYSDGFDLPVSMAWAPGTDDIYLTERSGSIRVLDGRRLLDEPCATVPASTANGTAGLLGIELSPSFARDRFLYIYYTDEEHGDNRVVRFTVTDSHTCVTPTIILAGIPTAGKKLHEGGQLEFSGDYLFVSTGEAGDAARSQDTDDLAGKILRLRPDGSVPEDNPFSDDGPNPVWAYGFHNPFGLAGGSDGDLLYATENGPFCSDEIDLIEPAKNYGWGTDFGVEECTSGVGDEPEPPIHRWETIVAPTDLLRYEGSLRKLAGLLVGDFYFGFLHHFDMARDGTQLRSETIYEIGQGYRIMDVATGPGGWLYLVTMKDGEEPAGRILRLQPR